MWVCVSKHGAPMHNNHTCLSCSTQNIIAPIVRYWDPTHFDDMGHQSSAKLYVQLNAPMKR